MNVLPSTPGAFHQGHSDLTPCEVLYSSFFITSSIVKQLRQKANAVFASLELYLTLCGLAALYVPELVDGASSPSSGVDAEATGHTAGSSYRDRVDSEKYESVWVFVLCLDVRPDRQNELYDRPSSEKGTKNIAGEQPEIADELEQPLLKKALKTVLGFSKLASWKPLCAY